MGLVMSAVGLVGLLEMLLGAKKLETDNRITNTDRRTLETDFYFSVFFTYIPSGIGAGTYTLVSSHETKIKPNRILSARKLNSFP